MDTMTLKHLLADFIKQHRWSYFFGVLLLIATECVALSIPDMLGGITDALASGSFTRESILARLMALMAVVLAVFVLKYAWRWLLIGNCRTVEVYLRDHLFRHLQTLPVGFYSSRKTGDLIAYAINDVQAIRMAFGPGLNQSLSGITTGVIAIAFMTRKINPSLTLFAMLPIPIAVFLIISLARPIRERFNSVQAAYATISDAVQENISGIRVVKSFAREDGELARFNELSEKRVETQMRLTRASALLTPAIQVCFGVSFLVFIIFGSDLVQRGSITVGDFVAFNLYLLAIMVPVVNIGRIMDFIQKGIASYRRLSVLFDSRDEMEKSVSDDPSDNLRGKIEFRGVSFGYPDSGEFALRDITLTIDPGTTLGIVGATASGKTTLANLLLRLYDVEEGEILLDGVSIKDVPIDILRERIGYVPQDNFLFSTTIRSNIEFFRRDYSDDEIEDAARQSELYESILAFPDGFETVVGERGVTLSGGQKQRLSIARALVKDPSILVLDDSLSAVDAATERKIIFEHKRSPLEAGPESSYPTVSRRYAIATRSYSFATAKSRSAGRTTG